jgi:hypothetical protein
MFSNEESATERDGVSSTKDISHLCVCLLEAVVLGIESEISMRLVGSIQGRQLLILLDSGSSHSFLSATLAHQLNGVSSMSKHLQV